MKDFHLFRKVFFKPGIFFYLVFYEFDSHCSGDLDGMFSFLASVEPCLCPPDASVSVGIDADPSLKASVTTKPLLANALSVAFFFVFAHA